MFSSIVQRVHDFSHLFFPHVCEACGSDILGADAMLCASCFTRLPETNFIQHTGNMVEQKFYGQLKLSAAGAAYYFTKSSMLQQLIEQLKYRNNKAAGQYLGKLTGAYLLQTNRFDDVDIIVPLPLNPKKEKKRGYNQAQAIAEGIAAVWAKPVVTQCIERKIFTETQTHKNRINRWQSMQDVFAVHNSAALENKHVLLVDDIVTTGATLQACGEKILQVPGARLSIITVAFTI